MRRSAICLVMMLAIAGPTAAQSPVLVKLASDLDGDGKQDTVSRTVAANGVWQVMVTLGETPAYPHRIVEGDDPGMGAEPIDILPPGEYRVRFQGIEGPRAFPNNVFVFDRRENTRRLVFWEGGLFRTAWKLD